MRLLVLLGLFALIVGDHALKPEEHWRPATGRDLTKYKPRIEKYNTNSVGQTFVPKLSPKPYEGKPRNFDDICGIENDGHDPRDERIVGGFEAEEHQWPWIVALFIDDQWFCGGSLITDDFVLTAAHCVEDSSSFDVWAGAHNVRASSEPERIEITSYDGWTHPQWDSNTLSNDLALIRLPQKITFTDNIRPACLPKPGQTADVGMVVTPIGWGRPSDSQSSISDVLRMVKDIPIMSNSDCDAVYGIVGPGVVCIDTAGGKGTCNGDSGGPLGWYDDSTERWIECGIVSFGASAGCERNYPAGFTRTEYYLDWIKEQAGIN